MELQFENFKVFLECYFNQSADLDELSKCAIEYGKDEKVEYVNQFINELNSIIDHQEWELARQYLNEYGRRYPKTEEMTIWIVKTIRNSLVEQ